MKAHLQLLQHAQARAVRLWLMLRKKVYVNDRVIGEARTWNEVEALLESKGIRFLDKPGVAEEPTAFYISAA